MNQPMLWLAAGILLATVALVHARRAYRALHDRLESERRHTRQMADVHLATIEALALAIDAKDRTAHNHVRRVQAYATGLARALGMSDDEIQAIRIAAVLHDIGKLAVPEHILSKPGSLTPDEHQKVRIHPQAGADIIAAVPFPSPVAPLILSHHERWDGRGYPAGLRAQEIPLGARVLCVADYFDALVSDRPYHKAMSLDAARSLLRQEAGGAFDPSIVDTFLHILPGLHADTEREPVTDSPVPPARRRSKPAPARPAGERRPSVFDDIALAHREIYALYQISQTMGRSLGVSDTMALIASKLTTLVPFSTCALFVYAGSSDTLDCRFATGIQADAIRDLTLRNGQGLSGWVAGNRLPLVNAHPRGEFESISARVQIALESALICPLVAGERVIGTLAVYHTSAGFYGDDHRRLLERVCEQAAAVIQNAILFEQTQAASLTDPLTGLPNSRFMLMHLTRELARAERLGTDVALVVMDLDGFKTINDTHGHHVGDRALRAVADALRTAIRPYDVCARYAGDEFVLVLADCGRDKAEHKRLELQRAVRRAAVDPRPGHHHIELAISAGAAVFPHDGRTFEALLAAADAQMYRDKGMGRRNAPATLGADRGTSEVSPV